MSRFANSVNRFSATPMQNAACWITWQWSANHWKNPYASVSTAEVVVLKFTEVDA